MIRNTAGLKLAAPSGQHIFHPPAISPVSECDQQSARLSKNIHWCPVKLAGLSARVCNDAEAGQSRGEWHRDSVCNSSMKGCYRPFEEPNQKNGNEQDCEKRDSRCGNYHGRLLSCHPHLKRDCSTDYCQTSISHSHPATRARQIIRHSSPRAKKTAGLEERVPRQRPFPWASRRAKSKSHRQESAQSSKPR